MTEEVKQNQENIEKKSNDKEYNFRALEAKSHEAERRAIEAERRASEAEKMAQEALQKHNSKIEEDDDDFVDTKKLNKKLNQFGENTKKQTQSEIQQAIKIAIEEEKQESWINANPDFYDVLQKHAQTFAEHDPELAKTILEMPEGFKRQKLVYKNIKALGIDKPKETQSTIQNKIDANRKNPYYQPSNIGSSPYTPEGDYSPAGQKQAYTKMKELQARLRI